MATNKPFYKNPVYVAGMLIGGVAIFMLTAPPEAVTVAKPKPKAAAKKADKNSIFIEDDYKATFESVSAPPRNIFKPLVTKDDGKLKVDASNPNGVPAGLAGGEGNWIYTGAATVNGSAQGLVENPSTGDSEFLVRGQKWKSCTVVDVSPDALVLRGADGTTVTISINGNQETNRGTVTTRQTTEQPQPTNRPALRGAIGRNPADGNTNAASGDTQ